MEYEKEEAFANYDNVSPVESPTFLNKKIWHYRVQTEVLVLVLILCGGLVLGRIGIEN